MMTLGNVRVLIVEDDWLQASELAHHFSQLGAEVVGPALSIEKGMQLAPHADVGILDINVSGEFVFPLADKLHEHGTPIVFYTAYSEIRIPQRFHFASRLNKPAPVQSIDRTMQSALAGPDDPADDIVAMLPRLRLSAQLLLHETQAADRLVEAALLRALDSDRPDDEPLEAWLNRLIRETADRRGRNLMT